MDAISKTFIWFSLSQRTSCYGRHLILESLLSDYSTAKTMLNDCESALADNTSKDLFGNKFKEEICRYLKAKTKPNDVFKGVASSNQPFRGDSLPSRVDRGRDSRGFTFSFKGLNFIRGKKFVSTTSQKRLQDLPQVHPLVGSLFPKEQLGRKVKVFSEKLGETVQ